MTEQLLCPVEGASYPPKQADCNATNSTLWQNGAVSLSAF